MAERIDKVTAAVPLLRLVGIDRELHLVEEQQLPAGHRHADAEREGKLVLRDLRRHRLQRAQIGEDRIRVLAGHLGEMRIGHRRVEMRPVAAEPLVERPVEFLAAPAPEAGRLVRRQVGGIDGAERRRQSAPARIGLAVFLDIGVAGDAVAGGRKVAAALHLREGELLRHRGRSDPKAQRAGEGARQQGAAKPAHERTSGPGSGR